MGRGGGRNGDSMTVQTHLCNIRTNARQNITRTPVKQKASYFFVAHTVLDVQSLRGADCNTDNNMVVVNVREILAVSKQAAQKFDVGRFNLRKLMSCRLGNSIRLRSQTGLQL